ncbi:MAG: hypothetical protein P8H36_00510 [Yoonia sp.]|nr:hypothetical protein [Yoonia sp.]MDG1767889.1 hypothetical protein [Yoonia sp.]MDG1868465.1 hypothetical protein [Yoonia sp.]
MVRFCVIGDGPDPDDTFNVAVRFTPDGAFKPLIRNASVQDAIDRVEINGGSVSETHPCRE